MYQTVRKLTVVLGLLALLLALPALFTTNASAYTSTAGAIQEDPPPGTVPTRQPDSPPGTVPPPTAVPPIVHPTATPHVVIQPIATATPAPVFPAGTLVIDGLCTDRVIGNRYSDALYGYVDGWLYRSRDYTERWRLVTTTPEVDTFIISPSDPDVLYSGGTTCDARDEPVDFYRSLDAGLSWTRLDTARNLRPLLVGPTNPERLFAAGCDGLYLSQDAGITWARVGDNLWNEYAVLDMDYAPLTAEEAEEDFDELNKDEQLNLLDLDNLFAGGRSADDGGVVGYSDDGGETWRSFTPLITPSPWNMHRLTVDPRDAGRVWFVDDMGVWSTQDGGERWEFSDRGLSELVDDAEMDDSSPFNDILYHPDDQLYLATIDGLYTKHVDAERWRKVTDTSFEELEILSIVFSETEPSVLLLNTEECVYTYEIEG